MEPFCTAGKVHVGLDESFSLGRHPLCRAEVAEIGLAAHFGRYVQRLDGVARRPRAAPRAVGRHAGAPSRRRSPTCPRGIIAYDWYYYPFGPGPRIELRNFAGVRPRARAPGPRRRVLGLPDERLVPPRAPARLRREDRQHPRLVAPVPCGRRRRHAGHLVGAQPARDRDDDRRRRGRGLPLARAGDRRRPRHARQRASGGCSAATAGARARPGRARLRRAGLRRLFPLGDQRAVGHLRDAAGRLPLRGRARVLRGACGAGRGAAAALPRQRRVPPLPGERDVYVRSAAAAILALRRAHRAQRAGATRAVARGITMLLGHADEFAATSSKAGRARRASSGASPRDRRVRGPNERIVGRDAARLRAAPPLDPAMRGRPRRLATRLARLRRLAASLRRPPHRARAPEGRRRGARRRRGVATLHGRTMIEFRAEAARPRTSIRREFSVPVAGPGLPLRVASGGSGAWGWRTSSLRTGSRGSGRRDGPPPAGERSGFPRRGKGFPSWTGIAIRLLRARVRGAKIVPATGCGQKKGRSVRTAPNQINGGRLRPREASELQLGRDVDEARNRAVGRDVGIVRGERCRSRSTAGG